MRYSKRMSFEERLALIRRGPDECWIWPWAKTPRGYGHFRRKKRDEYAHRAAYELLVGPIQTGQELDHAVCDTPSCCNPAHMQPRRQKAHAHRHALARTHCFRGHPLKPTRRNTWKVFANGRKMCRRCYEGWLAVRWDPVKCAEYGRTGKWVAKQTTLAERVTATAAVLGDIQTRETHCEAGHLRAEHGWKVFPNGFRLCLTCYQAKIERRKLRRRTRRRALRRSDTAALGEPRER